MIELKTPAEVQQMRPAGRFVASVLEALKEKAAVGVNLLELDELAHRMIRDAGATSCYIDYHPSFGAMPFGKVLCTSVNDAVLHGLPFDYVLQDGDLLSVDFAAELEGWVCDSALSVIVGTERPQDRRLIEATEVALAAGIEAARVGNKLGDISWAIGEVAHEYGLLVNLDFGGHGVGRTMHGEPHVPNDGRRGRGLRGRRGRRLLRSRPDRYRQQGAGRDVDDRQLRHRGRGGLHDEQPLRVQPVPAVTRQIRAGGEHGSRQRRAARAPHLRSSAVVDEHDGARLEHRLHRDDVAAPVLVCGDAGVGPQQHRRQFADVFAGVGDLQDTEPGLDLRGILLESVDEFPPVAQFPIEAAAVEGGAVAGDRGGAVVRHGDGISGARDLRVLG